MTRTRINGELKYLGSFNTQLEASEMYQKALENLDNFENPKQFRLLLVNL